MRRVLSTLLIAVSLSAFAPLRAGDKTFTPDTIHSRIGFTAKTLFKVEGSFSKYTAAISGDPDTLENAKVTFTIETASINTENGSRDNHLRSADFFDAAKYPAITFTSKSIWKQDGHLMVGGTLDMHGVKKDLVIPFDQTFGQNGAGNDTWSYEGELKINRDDWGVGGADIVAKIGLKKEVALDIQLVGFWH
ncbi:MAG: YceI family protein [Acidobacteria bacterium]|nr:YceI family protein [Acidobacteriota bacterium]